ncbi:MAG: hypothetical protein A2987_05925 [Omnitrophica bacterium RIFCSPLOWO2_01_FULL_45_10]|nr:MAG: hypothetical protein A2987_05925 [Omnitrophica bacterium RIFCSPLOWO2_01_FULL_45_10]
MRRNLIFILSIFLAATFITSCGKPKERRAKDGTVVVKAMKVRLEDLAIALDYAGTIKGQDEALVYPKVSGKVSEKLKEESSQVAKGEAILYIDRDEVGLRFERAPVESPLKGIVGRVYVDIGSNVNTQTAIALVTNTENVKVNLDIPEKYLPKVSLGQEASVSVDAYPNEKFIGKIVKVSPVLDIETRAAPIEIALANKDGRLRSGMFAKVRLVIEARKNVPIILKEAVIGKVEDTYVYVVENKKALMKKVKLGGRQGPYYEVLDGVKVGDLVVIMGHERLREDVTVEYEE